MSKATCLSGAGPVGTAGEPVMQTGRTVTLSTRRPRIVMAGTAAHLFDMIAVPVCSRRFDQAIGSSDVLTAYLKIELLTLISPRSFSPGLILILKLPLESDLPPLNDAFRR